MSHPAVRSFAFMLLLPIISCSDWNVQGPTIPTGGVEITRIGSLHLADSVYSLSYAEGFIFAKGEDFHRIDISTSPATPILRNTIPRFSYSNLCFTGDRLVFTESWGDSFLLVCDFDSGYTLSDTIHLDTRVRHVKSNGSHLFAAVEYGLRVVDLTTHQTTFSLSDLYYYAPKVYLDAGSLYLTNGDSIFVFALDTAPGQPELFYRGEWSSPNLLTVYNSFLYSRISGDTSQVQFQHLFTNEYYGVTLPPHSMSDFSIIDDLVFYSVFIPDSMCILVISSPNTGHPCIALKQDLACGYSYYYPIVAHDDYLYLCRGDSLHTYYIERFEHIWED